MVNISVSKSVAKVSQISDMGKKINVFNILSHKVLKVLKSLRNSTFLHTFVV